MNRGIIAFGVIAVCIMFIVGCVAITQTNVQATSDSIIVNTSYSSAIIDDHGVAIAVAPFACGIDTELWCDVASGMDANA